jgi:hypothetical protein
VTQPPWLHQFRFRWASAHPVIKPNHKGWVTPLFFGPNSKAFFFLVPPMDLSCSPNYLILKSIPIDSAPLSMWRVFFSKLFIFSHHCCKLKEHGHRSSSLIMFKEEHRVAVTWRSKQHEVQHLQEDMETRYVSYIFFYI